MNANERELLQVGWRVTILGVVVNAGLVVLKLAAGIFGHSQALIADAVHSVSDLVTDGIVLFGLKAGRKAPDKRHPFGHGRIETLATALVGLSLITVAAYLGFDAAGALMAGELSSPTPLALVGAGVSVLTKEVLYQMTVRAGRRARSMVVVANAWHHRSDAMSSVAVFIGAGAAQLNPDWRAFDPAAAILVAVFILRVAIGILVGAVKELVDTAPPEELIDQMERIARDVTGVLNVHDLKARSAGGLHLLEIHIEVDGSLTVVEGHAIAKHVEMRLTKEIGDLASVIVHVDPATS